MRTRRSTVRFIVMTMGVVAAMGVMAVPSQAGRLCHDELTNNDRPNVLVILTDDQGWGDVSLHGNRNLATPNLDALARSGARFTHFYVQPVCSPTRAEFLTGRWHPRGGVRDVSRGGERLDLDERTIADIFKAAGYRTGLFGKWHNGTQGPYHPIRRGFEQFYGFTSGHWGHYFSPMLEENNELTRGQGYIADDLTNHAVSQMFASAVGPGEVTGDDEHIGNSSSSDGEVDGVVMDRSPFFTVLTLNTPHSPMQVPDCWWDRVQDRELPDRGLNPDKEDLAFTRAALAMVENIDWNVGRMLATLRERKQLDNTIVVFFCDNGPNSNRWNGGLRGQKGSTDEGGTRSPLFISWPGHITPDTEITSIAGAVDLLPTLADLCDIELRDGKPLDGRSFASELTGRPSKTPDRTLFAHWNGKVSARDQRFRLDDKGRLYDIASDPGQLAEVTTTFPDDHQRLTRAVAAYRSHVLGELDDAPRPFVIDGADGLPTTLLPARDAELTGGLQRSSRHPNCSFITNWTKPEDRISWTVDVSEAGWFDVDLLSTCRAVDVGAVVRLESDRRAATDSLGCVFVIDAPVEGPDIGAADDRVPRTESLVRDFASLPPGLRRIYLAAGQQRLSLVAVETPGQQVMDFRMLILRRRPNE